MTNNMTLLRGGHIDALVVLATSSNLSIHTTTIRRTLNSNSNHSLETATNKQQQQQNTLSSSSSSMSTCSPQGSFRLQSTNKDQLNNTTTTTTTLTYNSNSNNNKNNFLFQEAFLTTYRTIIEPIELCNKLIYRYRKFAKFKNDSTANTTTTTNNQEPSNVDSNNNNIGFLITTSGGGGVGFCDDRFDLNRLKITNKCNRMAKLAARNSLTLLVRVLDDLE
jgi:hypothetical protein